MITEKEIARINELYHKSREGGGLTAEEKEEQAKLRRAYIDSVKANLGVYLKDIKNASEDTSTSGDVKEKVQKAMEKTDAELAGEEKSVAEAKAGNPEISSHLHI
ncbi:MAG: DUF896 domain-containing protein [Oribacterium sp.]|nr:DUF896 domain-containing protein [Oribacterium sp.]MBP3806691.1 DUF896 domain-containing protein [Oribacterium sp.]MBR1857534.1 DUF896 domain-containing protein [Oribacterium sp.]